MTNQTISLFIIAIACITIGCISCKYYQWKKAKGYIPLLVGLALLYVGAMHIL